MSEEKSLTKVDPRTGLVITVKAPIEKVRPPDPKSLSLIGQIAGPNPNVVNLRDHPEYAGMDLVTTDDASSITFGEGEQNGRKSSYLMMVCWITPPGQKPEQGKAIVLRTGAGNVYDRVAEAWVKGAFPIKGTLRKGGRAWFLD